MFNLNLSWVIICKPSFFLNLFFCVFRFFGLSSFEIVEVLILSCLASFLLFFSVIPEIFFVGLVDFWRPPNHVYCSCRTHYTTPVIQHVPRPLNTYRDTKETNPKVCKHIVFTSLIGLQHITFIFKIKWFILRLVSVMELQHVTFIFKIKWFILRLVGVMELQHVTFIFKIKSYICVTLKEQNSQINMFNKRNLYNITNCVLQRFAL